ncbi:hypothetical protein ONZ45_g9920 [Pleurotus djamor]|nr:hypothetical protein ONZ45_g9920 [Pleurotus djamor]
MVFYAYVSEENNDAVSRLLLAFVDAPTADEWWRTVNTTSYDYVAKSVKRISSEMYTHNTAQWNAYYFFEDARIKDISQQFRGKLIITWMNDRVGRGLDVFLNKGTFAEPLSGNWFYIRSTTDQSLYWYYDTNSRRITTSKTNRTLFRVSGNNLADKTVLVRSDNVSLTAYPNAKVQIDNAGDLFVGTDSWSFQFGDLASGRFIQGDYGLIFENVDAGSPKKPGWELVN